MASNRHPSYDGAGSPESSSGRPTRPTPSMYLPPPGGRPPESAGPGPGHPRPYGHQGGQLQRGILPPEYGVPDFFRRPAHHHLPPVDPRHAGDYGRRAAVADYNRPPDVGRRDLLEARAMEEAAHARRAAEEREMQRRAYARREIALAEEHRRRLGPTPPYRGNPGPDPAADYRGGVSGVGGARVPPAPAYEGPRPAHQAAAYAGGRSAYGERLRLIRELEAFRLASSSVGGGGEERTRDRPAPYSGRAPGRSEEEEDAARLAAPSLRARQRAAAAESSLAGSGGGSGRTGWGATSPGRRASPAWRAGGAADRRARDGTSRRARRGWPRPRRARR